MSGEQQTAEFDHTAIVPDFGDHPAVSCTACDYGYPPSACSSTCDCGAC